MSSNNTTQIIGGLLTISDNVDCEFIERVRMIEMAFKYLTVIDDCDRSEVVASVFYLISVQLDSDYYDMIDGLARVFKTDKELLVVKMTKIINTLGPDAVSYTQFPLIDKKYHHDMIQILSNTKSWSEKIEELYLRLQSGSTVKEILDGIPDSNPFPTTDRTPSKTPKMDEIMECIASGGNSVVRKCRLSDGTVAVVKIHEEISAPLIEILFHLHLSHPGIQPLLGWSLTNNEYYTFHPLGSRVDKVDDKDIDHLISTVKYLHVNNVVHRDIKSPNLIRVDGVIKLIDLGSMRHYREDLPFDYTTSMIVPVCNITQKATPEDTCEICGHFEFWSDVWALGVTIYDILTGSYPFELINYQHLHRETLVIPQEQDCLSKIKSIPGVTTDRHRNLLIKMLDVDNKTSIQEIN